MIKTLSIVALVALTGCASSGNQAYQAAHESAAKSRIAETTARADADKTLTLAVASASKSCQSDLCLMAAMMQLSTMKALASAGNAVREAAPNIAPPVNEAVEVFKDLTKTALGLYGIRVQGAIGLVNATRGAADGDAAAAGLKALDVYRSDTVNP